MGRRRRVFKTSHHQKANDKKRTAHKREQQKTPKDGRKNLIEIRLVRISSKFIMSDKPLPSGRMRMDVGLRERVARRNPSAYRSPNVKQSFVEKIDNPKILPILKKTPEVKDEHTTIDCV